MNTANTLHGGAIESLVDLVGSAAVFTVGAPSNGVSVEINVSYLDASLSDGMELDLEVLSKLAKEYEGTKNVAIRVAAGGEVGGG
uniref:Thioesterase domain-containing protein n=1 Tax=Chenopodium quinoa TaxID=63459 RepID=A0A803M9J7_CHEQI